MAHDSEHLFSQPLAGCPMELWPTVTPYGRLISGRDRPAEIAVIVSGLTLFEEVAHWQPS